MVQIGTSIGGIMSASNGKKASRKRLGLLFLLVLMVTCPWLLLPIVLDYLAPRLYLLHLQDQANIGDAYNVLSCLYSGLAMIAVSYALIIQNKQLRLQRRDLKHSQAELRLSRIEAVRSAAALEAQVRCQSHASVLASLPSLLAINASTLHATLPSKYPIDLINSWSIEEVRTEHEWALDAGGLHHKQGSTAIPEDPAGRREHGYLSRLSELLDLRIKLLTQVHASYGLLLNYNQWEAER
jgi:hypothetical protein